MMMMTMTMTTMTPEMIFEMKAGNESRGP
jgi:hypothetical protein